MTLQVSDGTNICFCVSGSLSPADAATDNRQGTPTYVTLTLASVADSTARQSNKADLGATRAALFALYGCVDFTGETPTSGGTIEYHWLPSTSSTAANGNIAGNSGVDAAAPNGCVPSAITLAEFKLLGAIYIGSLTVSDDAAVQNGFVGWLSPPTRYGQLLVTNEGGDAFEADDVEAHQTLIPVQHADG